VEEYFTSDLKTNTFSFGAIAFAAFYINHDSMKTVLANNQDKAVNG